MKVRSAPAPIRGEDDVQAEQVELRRISAGAFGKSAQEVKAVQQHGQRNRRDGAALGGGHLSRPLFRPAA